MEINKVKEEIIMIQSFIDNNPYNADNAGWKRCIKALKEIQKGLEESLTNGDV